MTYPQGILFSTLHFSIDATCVVEVKITRTSMVMSWHKYTLSCTRGHATNLYVRTAMGAWLYRLCDRTQTRSMPTSRTMGRSNTAAAPDYTRTHSQTYTDDVLRMGGLRSPRCGSWDWPAAAVAAPPQTKGQRRTNRGQSTNSAGTLLPRHQRKRPTPSRRLSCECQAVLTLAPSLNSSHTRDTC